jgi:hypothetical protein
MDKEKRMVDVDDLLNKFAELALKNAYKPARDPNTVISCVLVADLIDELAIPKKDGDL